MPQNSTPMTDGAPSQITGTN